MKKIRVKIAYELEIPDHWKVAAPSEDETKHLLIDGKYYQPDMTWMEYRGQDDDGHDTWVEADIDVLELIGDHIKYGTECSITRIRRFMLEKD
jgi:hypothetical protein